MKALENTVKREMGKSPLRGFTLLEMLVVIGIIAILVTVMVPIVRGAREKAKDAAVKEYCSAIEQALASFALAHDGNYPGVALDVMAPYPIHALGDPALYQGNETPPGSVVTGVIGGTGSAIPSTSSVYQLLKQVKDTPLAGNLNTPRYFDSLIARGAIDEFPRNPFKKSTGQEVSNRMINIFRFDGFQPPNPLTIPQDLANINPYLLVNPLADLSVQPAPGAVPEAVGSVFAGRIRLYDSAPGDARNEWNFYFDPDRYFAPGDFAYVPILSLTNAPPIDNPQTLENDRYTWGTLVTGYMLFGYGWQGNKTSQYEKEKEEFGRTGLPGFGAQGVDTPYEQAVYALFNGAVYFSKRP